MSTIFVRYLFSECNQMRELRVFESIGHRVTLSVNGRETLIGSFPVGIEPRAFTRLARRNEQSPLVKKLIASLGGRNLVIGVDRLDYSKGLIQRLDAFDIFLANHSEWLGKLTYLQITPKNRSEISQYSELEEALGSAAGRINGKYGEVSWTPIRYVNRVYSRSVLAGLYRMARVGLVTPLRDGMNLVAKEYVAAQDKIRTIRASLSCPVSLAPQSLCGARSWSILMMQNRSPALFYKRSLCRSRKDAPGTRRCMPTSANTTSIGGNENF